MECKNCELRQRQFYCRNCIWAHIRDFRLQTQHFVTDRDEQIAKGLKVLQFVEPVRLSRAELSSCNDRVEELVEGLRKLRKDNESKRDALRSFRGTLALRRRTLASAKALSDVTASQTMAKETSELATLSNALARARSGLVQELVEVFNITEAGGNAGTKGEWAIGNLILPVPGDIRRYPPDHINAVVTSTVHFLGLLTFYLGIKLPFEIQWSGKKLGVGQPWIGACKGTESGSWAKWTTKHPLHLSASLSSTSSPSSSSPSSPSSSHAIFQDTRSEDGSSTTTSFTTALAMLIYNVCYLAHTQSIDIPLSQAGDVLSNLYLCCCSELGRRSHQTTPILPPPTPPSFSLDFAQVLQSMTANPVLRSRTKHTARRSSVTQLLHREHRISEEEEDWHLVDHAAGNEF